MGNNVLHGAVDFAVRAQRVDGFGFSEAFGQAAALERLPAAERRQVLDLLFSRERGAGFSIMRLGLGAGTTLEPDDPGGPEAKPKYAWDGSDGGQVWLAREAVRAGVTQFTLDAWSAPPFMKSRRARIGGTLCGVAGPATNAVSSTATGPSSYAGSASPAACTADWRRAYAALLLAGVSFYRAAGVPVGSLSFLNEPEIHVSYESMLWTPEQAAGFLTVLGPMARKEVPGLKLACCDASTWRTAGAFTEAVSNQPARQFLDVVTGHEYGAHAETPLATGLPVWMTEWSSATPAFEARWDCGGCFGGPDGMSLARDVLRAFRDGGVSAYLYWWAAGDQPTVLMRTGSSAGPELTIAKRFYALAMVSRFVQVGASVVPIALGDQNEVEGAAFRNPKGGGLLALVNVSRMPKRVELRLTGLAAGTTGAANFVTDEARSMQAVGMVRVGADGQMAIVLPPRSMTSLVFQD